MLEMTYGLRDGELVSAKDVPRGLDCGCTCPACGSELVAKQGSCRVAHFAHLNRQECKGWLETVLHLRAKALLSEKKQLMVPPVYRIPGECIYPWSRIIFEKIDVEVSLGNGRADAVGITKGRALAVEFAVTHKVSENRILEYRKLGHAAVEICIPKVNRDIDGVISYILAKGDQNSRWIYNPHIEYDKWRNIKLGYKGYAMKPQSLRKRYYAYE